MRSGLIKIIAEKKGINLKMLADKAGISENQIHLIIRTGRTKVETLERIAEVLDTDVREFFGKTTEEKQTECEKELLQAYRRISALQEELRTFTDPLKKTIKK